jgi:hypothetical protein
MLHVINKCASAVRPALHSGELSACEIPETWNMEDDTEINFRKKKKGEKIRIVIRDMYCLIQETSVLTTQNNLNDFVKVFNM